MAVALSGATAAHADALQDIIQRGKLIVAMDYGAPPYSMTDENLEPVGSDYETAQLLAEDLGVELEVVQTTGQGRVPALTSGSVDLVIQTFSITAERAKAIAFSNPYGVIRSFIVGAADVEMRGYDDLVGKKIGVTRGTTQEPILEANMPEGSELIRFDDDAISLAALGAGQIDGWAATPPRLRTLKERYPDRNYESKFDIADLLYYAIGVRHNEPNLLQWVNTWLFINNNNGKLDAIYEKWIQEARPPMPTF
jgi:polar amino acid transport system substrate-binding protein